MIDGFNENDLLGINIDTVGSGSSKRCVDSRCVIIVINEQGDAIRWLIQNVHFASKEINIIPITVGEMVKYVHNIEKNRILCK